ncbi:MAG TPA: hypothetical protein PKO15_08360 [Fibrobacteria bacterium]|nr:hypothetical protein [Fibrobacteria bacterium]HOX52461.1 hypothetical protein [Fibrobacteria bacterium]
MTTRGNPGIWWKAAILIVSVVYLLFFLDVLEIVELSAHALKLGIYLACVFAAPVVAGASIWRLRGFQRFVALPALAVLLLAVVWGPLGYANRISTWRTRTELWVHVRTSSLRIEDQFQDIGALGYRSRTAKLFHLGDLFAVPLSTSPTPNPGPDWKATNREVDSMGHF